MKTLKEAYESVSASPQIGDIIGVHQIKDVYVALFKTFISFYPKEKDSREWYCTNENWREQKVPIITRNGKQIYPKVEEASAMQLKVDLLRYLEDNNTLMITETISDLIDAKIQEKRGGSKCNS